MGAAHPGFQQGAQLTGSGQIHHWGFTAGTGYQLSENGLGLHPHCTQRRIRDQLGGRKVVGGIGHHGFPQGGLGGCLVIGAGLLPFKGVAQRVSDHAGDHVAGELALVARHPELAQLGGYPVNPHILLNLVPLPFVADQHQHLPDFRQPHLNALQDADRPLPFQLGIVEHPLPLRASGLIALQGVTGVIAGVVVVFGGHQRQVDAGVTGRQ